MSKDKSFDDPIRKTKTDQTRTTLDTGDIKPTGVGLRAGELAAIEKVLEKHRLTRNNLLRYIIRAWLDDYLAGNIKDLPITKKSTGIMQELKIGKD